MKPLPGEMTANEARAMNHRAMGEGRACTTTPHGQAAVYEPDEGEPHHWDPQSSEERDRGGLRVTVLYTSIAGTLAALRTGAELAKGLAAEVEILVTEQVPFHYTLDRPPVHPRFYERLCLQLVREARLDVNAISIRIYFCRDRLKCLEQMLRPRSLVVIGAKLCWWSRRERALQKALSKMRHEAVLVRVTSRAEEHDSRAIVEAIFEIGEQ